jgi:hypothetical protein
VYDKEESGGIMEKGWVKEKAMVSELVKSECIAHIFPVTDSNVF